MFALRCQLLQGSYQAADPLLSLCGELVEWPPHPVRVHQALIAAAWATGDGHSISRRALDALCWLERQAPPALAVPDASTRTPVRTFVPRNPRSATAEKSSYENAVKKGKKPANVSASVERRFPAAVVGDEPVHMIWPGATDSLHLETLQVLAREIGYLGSSRSPVCCDFGLSWHDRR